MQHLVEHRDETLAYVRAKMTEVYDQLTSSAGIGGADQEGRVVNRFALCAAVGELAIKLGILPWTEGAAVKGVSKCFADWLDARGHGHLEALTAQRAFSQFVFSQGHRGDDRNMPGNWVRDRAFVCTRSEDGKHQYWFTPDSLAEACGQPQRVPAFLGLLSQRGQRGMGVAGRQGPQDQERAERFRRTVQADVLHRIENSGGASKAEALET